MTRYRNVDLYTFEVTSEVILRHISCIVIPIPTSFAVLTGEKSESGRELGRSRYETNSGELITKIAVYDAVTYARYTRDAVSWRHVSYFSRPIFIALPIMVAVKSRWPSISNLREVDTDGRLSANELYSSREDKN